jgi:hypothetical protein
MDSRFSHLFLLPVSALKLPNQFFLVRPTDLYMKRAIVSFAAQKRPPTLLAPVQVSASPVNSLDLQIALIRRREANQFILIVPSATSQTGSLWTVSLLQHANSF